MLRTLVVVLSLVLLFAATVRAADPSPAFTDPAEAGADFLVQGEYTGTVGSDEKIKVGVQIVALGDGEFSAVAYIGGLPGDGWNKTGKASGVGKTSGDTTTFTSAEDDKGGRGVLKDGVLTIFTPKGVEVGTLKKVERKSPTLGAKPPAGAVVLFDGTTADRFNGGRMTEDGLLAEGVTSKQLFGSFTIHVEFRTPFMPKARGQGRGNSGFYAQGRYETQILDSFGLEGVSNECGGIYKVANPEVNMCLPPLAWQTYDIDFTAAKFENGKKVKSATLTVKHNGVLVHDKVELPGTTTAAPVKAEGPEPGPVYLQNHKNPVCFRNIWVVEKK